MKPSQTLEADEQLGGQVSSKSLRRASASPDLPMPREVFRQRDKSAVSTDRLHSIHFPDVAGVARRLQETRDRNFYGWLVVTQTTATQCGRTITPSPVTVRGVCNPYHADIVLPSAVADDTDLYEAHLTALAATARWCPA